ncbi:MAG: response regulator [Bacteroidia bacterium]|nr:response regulator [Bacteroidia bacterium]MDW8158054.1 response regulator [Bacteroidia bacterium]
MAKKPAILCVDDEKVVTDTLVSQIRLAFGNQFSLLQAGGVEEAFEVIEELKEEGVELKLIISDWLMPPHRGDQFLKAINETWPEVKLIMLSGQADEEAIQRVKALSSLIAYVRKPWDKEEIIQLINQHVLTQ